MAIGSQIESEYIIQRRAPGVSLKGIYRDLGINEKELAMNQVMDLLAEMKNIQLLATGQPVATGSLPDALSVDSNDISHLAGLTAESFLAGYGEHP